MLPNAPTPSGDDLRCYVIINTNILTPIQVGVQAAHALAELVHKKPMRESTDKWVTKDKTLIFLSATENDRDTIMVAMNRLGKTYASFREPDIGDVWTATAFEPIPSDLGRALFGRLSLAK